MIIEQVASWCFLVGLIQVENTGLDPVSGDGCRVQEDTFLPSSAAARQRSAVQWKNFVEPLHKLHNYHKTNQKMAFVVIYENF